MDFFYHSEVYLLMREGISDGTRPNDFVTRQELWVMLYRLEGYK